MADIQIAHIRHQGVNLLLVPVSSSYSKKPREEQIQFERSLLRCAAYAGLKGTIVPVWEKQDGCMGFMAPKPFHSFLASLNMNTVRLNFNRKLKLAS